MNKKLLAAIVLIACALIGAVIYIGVKSLEPRAYAPQLAITPEKTTPLAETTKLLQVNESSQDIPKAAAIATATNEETKQYTDALPHNINPATLKLNLLDIRAIPYKQNEVFVIERPSALIPSSAWIFNTKTKALTPIAEKEYGLMMRWFENGRYALMFSVGQAQTPSLIFTDAKTNQRLPVRFVTLPDKCAVYGEQPIIYCGVPKTLPPGVVLPDDYLKKKLYTDDRIMMIDIDATRVREISDAHTPLIDMYNPVVMDNALFFTNRRDEKIYKLPIK